MHSSIRIVTRFRLIDAKAGRTADIVTWRGREYTVTNVNDFTNWGRGFIEAHAELRNFSG